MKGSNDFVNDSLYGAKELCVLTIDEELGMPSLSMDETEIFLCNFNSVMQRLNLRTDPLNVSKMQRSL